MSDKYKCPEIQAMSDCYVALRPLGRDVAKRVQQWLNDRLGSEFDRDDIDTAKKAGE